jgi:hypothetical protein
MSRFAFSLSLILSLSTSALAERAEAPSQMPPAPDMKFAQPPDSGDMPVWNGARFDRTVVRLDRAAIRAKLAQNRIANLARFRIYQKKGVFPSNTYTDVKLNVWHDQFGNFCAAATIIKLSGQDDLVNTVADQDNFIRLADVSQGPLMDWILTSGLTQDEIAAIQEPFMPVVREPVTEPQPEPAIVNNRLRKIEDRRLSAKYKQVDSQIVKNARKSLDKATDRLMSNPDLARQFLDG